MLNYEDVKAKAVETINHGAWAIALSKDHEDVRKMANSVMEACRLLLWLEDLQEAKENLDLTGMMNAKTKNGF